jgi:hypothetical protein
MSPAGERGIPATTRFAQQSQLTGKKVVGNAFQNVERGRVVFAKIGIDPFDRLSEDELDHIRLNIQKRHILGHNLGMADEHYARFAEDHEPGETVTLIGADIRRFAELCFRVVDGLEDSLMPSAAVSPPSPA